MRSAVVLTLASFAFAFPAAVLDQLSSHTANAVAGCPYAAAALKHKRQAPPDVVFDPVKQKVDVSGRYTFVPPKAGDKRGPCPGLNSLANHGYLPHNGVTSIPQAIEACNKVFGMSLDLGTFLSIYATCFNGNPLTRSWSIGGATEPVLPPLLSAPQGLSGAHNSYEGDVSPTRTDAYLNNGDATSLNMTFFKQLYDLQPEGSPSANFDYDTIVKHRAARRQDSVATNPYYFSGIFTGLIALPAAYSFITRFMSNHSAENPAGVLNHEVLKSFYAVSGTSNSLTYQKGYERIPKNWYKRNVDYSIPLYLLDVMYAANKHPEFISLGGNTGKVNSFAGVDLSNVTSGVYNSKNLLEGNYLFCFAFQAAQQILPDFLKGVIKDDTGAALGVWNSKIPPLLSGLGCPELSKYDPAVFGTYPGSSVKSR